MLNHKWMPKRDRSIRRPARDAEDPLDADAGPPEDRPEASLADAAEAQSQEAREMVLAQAPAGPEATTERPVAEQDSAQVPAGPTQAPPEPADTEQAPTQEAAAPVRETDGPRDDVPSAAASEAEGSAASEPPEGTPEPQPPARRDARAVAEKLQVPQSSLRDRLESVLSHQAQLPLDIDARHAVSAGAEGSPRETRELLLQRLLDPTLTLQEAATLLGVCTTTIRRYTDRGLLRCFRTPGNQRRFHLSDVLDFMERQQRSG